MFFNKLFAGKKPSKEYYLGLFLKSNEAVGFVFEVSGSHLLILDEQQVIYSNGFENILQDIDDLVFNLEHKTKIHLKQTIFFVYSYFIDQTTTEIKQPYKDLVKNLVKNLELKPLGYIECFEAVSSYLQKRDRQPLNALIIELDKKNIDLCIFKSGKKSFVRTSSRTDNIIDDLKAMLSEFKDGVMPSRMILYDSSDLHDEAAAILAYKWDNTFVQLPKVEIIKKDYLYRELGEVFVAQMQGTGENVDSNPSEMAYDANTSKDDLVDTSLVDKTIPAAAAVTAAATVGATESAMGGEVMGFRIGEDIASDKAAQHTKGLEFYEHADSLPASESSILYSQEEQVIQSKPLKSRKSLKFPSFKFNIKPGGKVAYIGLVVGLLLIIGSLAVIEYYFHKATIIVYLPSKSVEKDLAMTLSIGKEEGSTPELKSSDYASDVSQSSNTSGKRDVGEKARGSVTVNNFEDSPRSISKGTTLDADGIKFVLDSDITVASSSETLINGGYVKEPGKTQGSLTAAAIGTGGNIAKGKRFKIGDLSSSQVFAVNDTAFTGGTQKSVKTVSRSDLDELKATLLAQAKKDAHDGISKNVPSGAKVMDELTDTILTNIQTTKELGEEADSVKMTAKGATTYYYYDISAMNAYLSGKLKEDAPADFQLDPSKTTFTVKDVKKKSDQVTANIHAQTLSIKEVNKADILKKVVGSSKSNLDSVVRESFNAQGYRVDINAPLPILDQWMPFLPGNIDVKTSSM